MDALRTRLKLEAETARVENPGGMMTIQSGDVLELLHQINQLETQQDSLRSFMDKL